MSSRFFNKETSEFFTASRTGLLFSDCKAWAHGSFDDDTGSYAASRGTELHKLIEETLKRGDKSSNVAEVNRALGWIHDHNLTLVDVEVSYSYCPTSGMSLTSHDGRDSYKTAPNSIWGTIDAVFKDASGRVYIVDWKSSTTSSLKAGPQLKTLAALYALFTLEDEVAVCAVSLEDGRAYSKNVYRYDELEEHLFVLARRLLDIRRPSLPVLGEHCTSFYCPKRFSCETRNGVVDAVAEGAQSAELVKASELAVISDAHKAMLVYDTIKHCEDILDRAKSALKAFGEASGGEVVFEDGRKYKCVKQSKSSLDASELARRMGASEEDLAMCTKVSQFNVWRVFGGKKAAVTAKKEEETNV